MKERATPVLLVRARDEIERLQRALGECSGALESVGHPIEWQKRIDAAVAAERERTLEEVLRGLRSEMNSTQLRAIIASVEALMTPNV